MILVNSTMTIIFRDRMSLYYSQNVKLTNGELRQGLGPGFGSAVTSLFFTTPSGICPCAVEVEAEKVMRIESEIRKRHWHAPF